VQVVLIVAQSLDGFITRHDTPGAGWASAADQRWFRSQLALFESQIMARTTYETVREEIRGRTREADPVRMIMTRHPEAFAADTVPDKLEFSAATPPELLARLEDLGVGNCALLGGAAAHDAFLEAGLVDELRVTIEPRLFGGGTPVVRHLQDRHLELIDIQRLPDSDSCVARYKVRS
jgi:dihydrofolate reductase